MFGSYRSRASLGDQGVIGAGPTTQAVGEDGGGIGLGAIKADPNSALKNMMTRAAMGFEDGGGGKAPGIENSMAVTTRALGEDASGGMIPGFGGNLATTMAVGENGGGGSLLKYAPGGNFTTAAVGENGGGGLPPMSSLLPNTVEPGQGLISSMMTQAMGEQEGDMMMPPLIIDDGPPSGISNFATAAVGEHGGGGFDSIFSPDNGGGVATPPGFGPGGYDGGNLATTAAVGEEDGNRPLPPASGPGETLPPSFGPTTLAMGEEDGGGGNLLPEPFEPPSQSRTTELIEELISLLRGSRPPPNVFQRPMPRPRPQPIFSPPPPRTPPPAPVSGTGVLGSLASNPLFQDFATQLQSSNPQQSDILSEMFKSADQKSQGQNQFAPQSNPFMSSSSPFMAPPQFFAPKAYGQFAPPPMGFSQFQPPIPYGSAGGFASPPPQFAPMQQGTGDSSPFASSIRNVGFA